MNNKITKLVAKGIDIYRGAAAYPAESIMAFASGLITSDATAPSNNETITIGTTVYTAKTALSGAAYEVLIGISASVFLDNLKSAINATAGAGTTYGLGTSAHPLVTANTKTATTLLVVAKAIGSAGNSIATTETSAHLSWGSTTLTALEVDPASLGSLAGEGENQVTFSLVNVSDSTAVITFSPEELFSYPNDAVPQVEQIGYVPMMECLAPSTSKAMVLLERTFTGATSYSFTLPKTIADRVHLRMKADKAVTGDLYQSACVNEG